MAGTAGKFLRGLKARGMSMTALIALSIIAAAVVPLFLLTALMLQSFSQTQLDARGIDIQNQCMNSQQPDEPFRLSDCGAEK